MLPRATASVTDNNSVQNLNQTRLMELKTAKQC
jgi:hypothetical protein